MPVQTKKAGDCRGTDADGSKNDKWCILCYKDGKFLEPDCTVDQMIEIVDKELKEHRSSFVMRWMAKKQIPKLERWR